MNKLSFCSNIDSKSSNNTYLNIIEILNYIIFITIFLISCINIIEFENLVITLTWEN